MAALAVRLARGSLSGVISPHRVHPNRHSLKMCWVNASLVLATVINDQMGRHSTVKEMTHQSIYLVGLATDLIPRITSLDVATTSPVPATTLIDFRPRHN